MIQILGIIITFLIVNWVVWLITEKYMLVPECLSYRPFICRICATFWTLITISVAYMVQGWWIMGIGLAVLAILNAVAMKIHQRQNTEEL